ncbi:hypothetical protein N9496_07295 [Akkermansiaceae bacterium]|nr:hypothetical protein [Akkermansiaceae bacterium]
MGADMTMGMVPAVEMTDDRCAKWDSICESLEDLDEGYDVYEFLDDCETHEDKINALKALKEEYGQRVSGNYRDIDERTIQGVRYLFSGAMSWGDDLPESAELFMRIEGISKIFDWLEQEALEDLKRARTLDLAKAEQFLEDDESIDLGELTSITDEAAEVLSRHQGGGLHLYGLTALSNTAAESFSKIKGADRLFLSGLASISDAAAQALSRYQGWLCLGSFTELSDAAAESLSKHKGGLRLNGLTTLTDATAESLSRHEGDISLNGLTTLTDAAAKSLSRHEGELNLDGLTTLTDASAESLSKHKGNLTLNGLTSLTNASAEALSKHDGALDLGGLVEINSSSLAAVMRWPEMHLSVTSLVPDVASELWDVNALREFQKKEGFDGELNLESLKDASLDTLRVLTEYPGRLALGIDSLSIDAARVLSEFNGASLALYEVTAISDQVADALAEYKGDELNLSGLSSLSDAAAESLSRHQGVLYLESLTTLSDAAADSLSKHKGEINWEEPAEWADSLRQS